MRNVDDMRALRTMRIALLVAIALDLGLIGAHILLYPLLLAQPNSIRYIAEPLVLLVGYAVIVHVATAANAGVASARRATLSLGMVFGVITGALWLVNLTLETFVNLSGLGLLASGPFLLGAF